MPSIQEYIWVFCFIILGVITNVFAKQISLVLNPVSIVFHRTLFSLVIFLLLSSIFDKPVFAKTLCMHVHVIRGVLGILFLFCMFISLKNLSFSLCYTIVYLYPIVVILLGVLFFGEKSFDKLYYIIFFCCAGLLLIFSPKNFYSNYIFIPLFGIICKSFLIILNKKSLDYGDSTKTILLYYFFWVLFFSVFFIHDIQSTELNIKILLFLISAVHFLCLYCFLKAMIIVINVNNIILNEYIVLLFSVLVGIILFGDYFLLSSLLGFSLILFGIFFFGHNNLKAKS
jgi:drug/metabolite transporter (DMT)-like permease